MLATAQDNSLFEIDRELDLLLDQIQDAVGSEETDDVQSDLLERFQAFCEAHSEKVDRIGRFLSLMESRAMYCRSQATRLSERARSAENKVKRTENMVLYHLKSRDLRKIEGREFILSLRKNSQDSVVILNESAVPMPFREIEAKIPGRLWETLISHLPIETERELSACIRQMKPSNEAIKLAVGAHEEVPGTEVRRGFHLRVA